MKIFNYLKLSHFVYYRDGNFITISFGAMLSKEYTNSKIRNYITSYTYIEKQDT